MSTLRAGLLVLVSIAFHVMSTEAQCPDNCNGQLLKLNDGTLGCTCEGCGGIVTNRSTVITTPSYPNNYPDYTDCMWVFRPSGNVATISLEFFNKFDIPGTPPRCGLSAVYIYDGPGYASDFQGPYCGTELPAKFTGSGQELMVEFIGFKHTEDYAGFQAKLTVYVCEGWNLATNTVKNKSQQLPSCQMMHRPRRQIPQPYVFQMKPEPHWTTLEWNRA